MKFAAFFMAEYCNMIIVCSVATALFLGGWHPLVPPAIATFVPTPSEEVASNGRLRELLDLPEALLSRPGVTQEDFARFLARRGDFDWCADTYDDDLPYWDRSVPGGPMFVLPYALDCNDMKFFHPNGFVLPGQFVDYAEAAIDTLIAEGERGVPKLLNIGLHLRICGRPARFAAVEGILGLLARRGDKVWVARRRDIAAHARAALPLQP